MTSLTQIAVLLVVFVAFATGQTVARKKINDACTRDNECRSTITNSQCSSGRCACNSGYQPNTNMYRCIKRKINDACSADDDCNTIPNAECATDQNLCVCLQGYIANATLHECYKRQLNDTCTDDEDCSTAVSNSACSNDKRECVCASGFKPDENHSACIPLELKDACKADVDCSASITNSECSDDDNECVCSLGYQANDKLDGCVPLKLNDTCRSDTDCTTSIPESECSNEGRQCVCSLGYSANDKLTECARLKIGNTCSLEMECGVAVNNSFCNTTSSKCECDSNYIANDDNTDCVERKLEDPCATDDQCLFSITNSLCGPDDGRCQCIIGYRADADNADCVPRLIGDECSVDKDCSLVPISECVPDDVKQDRCTCKLGFIQTDNSSMCVPRKITDPCKIEEDCTTSVNDSRCLENKCECILGWRVTNFGQECVKRTVFDGCATDEDCSNAVANSECSSFQCVCRIGYQMERDRKTCKKSGCPYPAFVAHENTAFEVRELESATSMSKCSRVCLEKSGCNGFDWEYNSQIGSQCWLTGPDTKKQAYKTVRGTTHFFRKCAACPEYEFLEKPADEDVLGFFRNRSSTIDDCKDSCVSTPECTGIEWSNTNPTGYQCWLTGPRISRNDKRFGKRTHYQLDCKENIMYALRLTPNMVTLGNVLNAAKTVVDCSAACLGTLACDGFDWTESNKPGLQCWLSGPWTTGTERVEGGDTVHYQLESSHGSKDPWASQKAASKTELTAVQVINPCKMNPCLNGGRCKPGNRPGTFLCSCEGRWTGSDCSIQTAEPSTAEEKLLRGLLGEDDIRTLSRPFVKFSDSIEVQFAVQINKVIELDELQEMMTTGVQYDISWKDNRLSWNKFQHENITHINVPTEKIWTPEILLMNAALEDGVRVGGGADERAKKLVRIKNNGKCYWRTLSVITSHCQVDVRHFPFDEQICSLKFQIFHPKAEVKLNAKGLYKNDGYAASTDYKDDGEWALRSTVLKPGLDPENYSYHLEIELHLARKSFYYVLNFVVPCFTFSVIGALTFLLPPDSGDRIGLGVSLLLGITVYQMIINDRLPATSDTIPLLGIYFLFVMITCALSIGMFIIVTALHSTTMKMPPKLNRFVVWLAPYLLVTPAKSSTDKADADAAGDNDQLATVDVDDAEKQKKAIDANGRVDHTRREGMKAARDSFFGSPAVGTTSTTDLLLQAMLSEMQRQRELTEELKTCLTSKPKPKDDGGSESGSQHADEPNDSEEWLLVARVIDRLCFLLIVFFFLLGTIHFFANSITAKPHVPAGIDE